MKLCNKKTGEIGIINLSVICDDLTYCYETIECLLAEWEVANTKEPLINDEKIRKAVRAWAEAVGKSDSIIEFDESGNSLWCNRSRIRFDKDELKGLKDWQVYTIADLCGEEEE